MQVEGDQWGDREFRHGVWHRTATTVAMVTVAADDCQDVMACEWAMMVSSSPLRFVISVAPERVTADLIERAGTFGLNFCSDRQARLSHVSGSYSASDVDKWALADFPARPGERISAPMIEGCVLNVECRVVGTHALGDHTLYIGEALWARFDPDCEPLIYHDGRYFAIGAQLPKE